jgi:hypothetical protein
VLELYKQGSIDIEDAIEYIDNGASLNVQPQSASHLYFAFPSEKECTNFNIHSFCAFHRYFLFLYSNSYKSYTHKNKQHAWYLSTRIHLIRLSYRKEMLACV